MSDVEFVVNFGSEKSSQFVKLSIAEVECHGARLGEHIVRCRDCAKWATEKRFTDGCCGSNGDANPDGFCAWGERKGDA